MSLLANHGMISGSFATPALVRSTVFGIGGVNPAVVNVGSITPNGNLMVIAVMGVQTRTITSVTGSWSSEIAPAIGGGGTCSVFYRIASSEPGTTYTVTLSGSTNPGAIYYYEFSNINQSTPFHTSTGNASAASITSLSYTPFNVSIPSAALAVCQLSSGVSPQWQCDSSYINFPASSVSRAAYKIYNAVTPGENVTWSGGTSTSVRQLIVFFKARNV